jgi:hypothetical protein
MRLLIYSENRINIMFSLFFLLFTAVRCTVIALCIKLMQSNETAANVNRL